MDMIIPEEKSRKKVSIAADFTKAKNDIPQNLLSEFQSKIIKPKHLEREQEQQFDPLVADVRHIPEKPKKQLVEAEAAASVAAEEEQKLVIHSQEAWYREYSAQIDMKLKGRLPYNTPPPMFSAPCPYCEYKQEGRTDPQTLFLGVQIHCLKEHPGSDMFG
jgi:hypothetical protein